MKKMKILMTSNELNMRSGSELYVLEVGSELIKRGHDVIAYSNVCGELAKEIKKVGLQVVDDLRKIPEGWEPDIIHGQHHLEAMTAMLYFPSAPMVYFCHGWRPWQEKPPLHPRILEYVTVDTKTLQFMVDCGVPKNKIALIHNFVDLERFKRREPLPETPGKALVFSNTASEKTYLPVVEKACSKAGIELDVIGFGADKVSSSPEKILPNYDLVFAIGRSALEALAVGNAVIISGIWGIGPMANFKEIKRLRDQNFGVASMYGEINEKDLFKEICKYNAKDSAKLTEELRKIIGLGSAVDKIEEVYRNTMELFKDTKREAMKENKAVAEYLKEKSTFFKEMEHGYRRELEARMTEYEMQMGLKENHITNITNLEQQLRALIKEKEEQLIRTGNIDELKADNQALQREIDQKNNEITAMKYSKFWQAREVLVRVRKRFKK